MRPSWLWIVAPSGDGARLPRVTGPQPQKWEEPLFKRKRPSNRLISPLHSRALNYQVPLLGGGGAEGGSSYCPQGCRCQNGRGDPGGWGARHEVLTSDSFYTGLPPARPPSLDGVAAALTFSRARKSAPRIRLRLWTRGRRGWRFLARVLGCVHTR